MCVEREKARVRQGRERGRERKRVREREGEREKERQREKQREKQRVIGNDREEDKGRNYQQ